MKDARPTSTGDPDRRRPGSPGRKNGGRRGYIERATASGYSGYGSESVRPHLRDQLQLKSLLPQPFPTPEQDGAKDQHHQ